jgi:tetratricopeptide (TPR) repeat protein
MGDQFALDEFKQGIKLLRKGYPIEAYEYLRHAAALDEENPYYLSFLGLAVARGQRDWNASVKLCDAALRMKRNEAQLYLNLAEVCASAGRRDDAVEVLDAALVYCGTDPRVRQARGKLGKRGSVVLPFLDRRHFLNRSLGKLKSRFAARLRKSPNDLQSPAYANISLEDLGIR